MCISPLKRSHSACQPPPNGGRYEVIVAASVRTWSILDGRFSTDG